MAIKKVRKRKKKKPKKGAVSKDLNRTATGNFAKGNKASVGRTSPVAPKRQHLNQVLFKAVSDADIRSIVKRLVKMAKAGDIEATKVLFNRVFGKPIVITTEEEEGDSGQPKAIPYILKPPSGK